MAITTNPEIRFTVGKRTSRGVIAEIRTYERTYLPTDNVLFIAMEFGMANQYVRDLSVNIRRGIREKVRRGIPNGKAALGYFNEPSLRTIEPQPKIFPKLKRILKSSPKGNRPSRMSNKRWRRPAC